MTITAHEELGKQLHNYPGVFALVGENINFLSLEEEGPLPAIAYFSLPSIPEFTHSGYSGISEYHFQIDCYASTELGALQLAEQVCLALNFWGIGIQWSQEDDPSEPSATPGRYRVIVDSSFMF